MTLIVTSGSAYIDIDALACAEAYGDFLACKGKEAQVVFSPSLNGTVPPMIRSLPTRWIPAAGWRKPSGPCRYVLMDVSNPAFFDPVVEKEAIVEVFDHHHGFEDYWRERPGVSSCIEPIGACATLVWERICAEGYADKLSRASGQLLLTAIVSNALDFRSAISNARDRQAYDDLARRTGVGESWKTRYFEEVSEGLLQDPVAALLLDQKRIRIQGHDLWVGQAEFWDARKLLEKPDFATRGKDLFARVGRGFANLISISEGVNYIRADSDETASLLGALLDGKSVGPGLVKTGRLWLRKEIFREVALREKSVAEGRA